MKSLNTFYIRTYGCQMNELDTEVMVGLLEKRGLKQVEELSNADLIIFNTCSIRDLAERKVMGKLGQLGRKQKNAIIGVAGCMAMAKKEKLFQKLPHVDFVLGPNNINQLNNILDDLISTNKHQILTEETFVEPDYLLSKRNDKIKAYVSIIRGCSKFCTYCIVPYTRGMEVSRPAKDIVIECQYLAGQGYKEVTLLGQNVNSYRDQNIHFHDLLYKLDSIKGIERIRFMTSHPIDITKELMEAIRDLPSLCEFVHFPIQSGSNRILKKMNRIYTKEHYIEQVHMLRELIPNVSIGTDIIVGFPTETDEEFEETFEIMKNIEYSVAFLFAYSPRKGTPATRFGDNIPKEVKQHRLQKLIELQKEISNKHFCNMIDQRVEILVERKSLKNPSLLQGRTRCWKNVLFAGDENLVGTLQNVRINSFNHQTLLA